MTEPYLILHKVRGQPAFDIAIQMECPICKEKWEHEDWICGECEGAGYWWIIPTSGHRAYPYQANRLDKTIKHGCVTMLDDRIPDDWPDHCQYDLDRTPRNATINSPDVANALASLIKPQAPIVRRKL